MLTQEIAEVIAHLRAPLDISEIIAGWTQEKKEGYIPYFEDSLVLLRQGKPIEYSSMARSLDAWGISGGILYSKMMDVANQLNASS